MDLDTGTNLHLVGRAAISVLQNPQPQHMMALLVILTYLTHPESLDEAGTKKARQLLWEMQTKMQETPGV